MACKYVYTGGKLRIENENLSDLLNTLESKNIEGIYRLFDTTQDLEDALSAHPAYSGPNKEKKRVGATTIVDWANALYNTGNTPSNISQAKSHVSIVIGNAVHKAMEAYEKTNMTDIITHQVDVYNDLHSTLSALYGLLSTSAVSDIDFPSPDGGTVKLTPLEQKQLLKELPSSDTFVEFKDNFLSLLASIRAKQLPGSRYLAERKFSVKTNERVNSTFYEFARMHGMDTAQLEYITGAIDGICIEGDKIVLYDYKTHLTDSTNYTANAKAYLQLQLYKQMLLKIANGKLDESQIDIKIVHINMNNFLFKMDSPVFPKQAASLEMFAQNLVGTVKVIDPDSQQTIERSYDILNEISSPSRRGKRTEEGLKKALSNVPRNNMVARSQNKKKITKYTEGGTVEFDDGSYMDAEDFVKLELEERRKYNRTVIKSFKQAFASEDGIFRLGKTDAYMKQFLYNLRIYTSKGYKIVDHAGFEEQGYILLEGRNGKMTVLKFHPYKNINETSRTFLKGQNIFGDIIDDIDTTKFSHLPEPTYKNIEIMNILTLANAYQDMFPNGFQLQDIILIHEETGKLEPVLSIEEHNNALIELKQKFPDKLTYDPIKLNIAPSSVRLEQQVIRLIDSLGISQLQHFNLEGLSLDDKIAKIKEFRELIATDDTLKRQLTQDRTSARAENDVELIYRKLGELQANLEGIKLDPNKVNDYSVDYQNTLNVIGRIFKDKDTVAALSADGYTTTGVFLGRQFATAYNNPDNIIFEMDKLINAYNDTIRRVAMKDIAAFNAASEKFLALISTTKRLTNHDDHYKQLFDLDENGELAPSMTFKNPFETSLPQAVKEYLELCLWQKAKHSMKILSDEERMMSYEEFKKTSSFDKYKRALKESENRYYPLRQTGALRAFSERIKGKLKNTKDFKEILWSEVSTHFVPSQYNKDQRKESKEKEKELRMYNPYDTNEDVRNKSIEEHGVNFFDLNVNSVMIHYSMANIKQTYYNQLLSQADLIFGALGEIERMTGQPMDKTRQTLKDRLAVAVYGRNLTDDDFEDANKVISVARSLVSGLTIAARPLLLAKELTVGTMKLAAKCRFGYFANLKIDEKLLAKAMKVVYGQDFSTRSKRAMGKISLSAIDLVAALNQQYGIANFDLNIMAERMQADRHGAAANVGRLLYSTSTIPDFYNRMSIFIAAMMADGCFEAHSYDSATGELVYDMKKDKRFAKFMSLCKGPESSWDEEYFEQKGLYMAMAREFNRLQPGSIKIKDNGPLSERNYDPLPAAYTPSQKASINEQITTVFGAYDHELSATFQHGQYAHFFVQFMTYMNGEFRKLFAVVDKDSNTNIGRLVPKKNKDGLIVKTDGTLDPNTNLEIEYTQADVDSGKITAEQFAQMHNVMAWSGHPIEGIAVSMLKTVKDVFSGDFKKLLESDDPMDKQQVANTKVFLFNLLIYGFFGSLLGVFLGLMGFDNEEEMGYVLAKGHKMLSNNVAQEFSITQSILSPIADLGFIGVDKMEQLANDALSMVTKSDYNVMNFITENISTFKDAAWEV